MDDWRSDADDLLIPFLHIRESLLPSRPKSVNYAVQCKIHLIASFFALIRINKFFKFPLDMYEFVVEGSNLH